MNGDFFKKLDLSGCGFSEGSGVKIREAMGKAQLGGLEDLNLDGNLSWFDSKEKIDQWVQLFNTFDNLKTLSLVGCIPEDVPECL